MPTPICETETPRTPFEGQRVRGRGSMVPRRGQSSGVAKIQRSTTGGGFSPFGRVPVMMDVARGGVVFRRHDPAPNRQGPMNERTIANLSRSIAYHEAAASYVEDEKARAMHADAAKQLRAIVEPALKVASHWRAIGDLQ